MDIHGALAKAIRACWRPQTDRRMGAVLKGLERLTSGYWFARWKRDQQGVPGRADLHEVSVNLRSYNVPERLRGEERRL